MLPHHPGSCVSPETFVKVRIHAMMSEARAIVRGRYRDPDPADSLPFFVPMHNSDSRGHLQRAATELNQTEVVVELEVRRSGLIWSRDGATLCSVERDAVAKGRNARIVRAAEP